MQHNENKFIWGGKICEVCKGLVESNIEGEKMGYEIDTCGEEKFVCLELVCGARRIERTMYVLCVCGVWLMLMNANNGKWKVWI